MANRDVVHGGIICPTTGDTRNEEDCQRHIQKTTQSDPTVQQWCIVLDNLNPHQPEALVRWIAAMVGTEKAELGE